MKVAIIGGGAAGIISALHLLRLPPELNLEILLFEQNPNQLGRGVAYSTESSTHLLNVPVNQMGALAGEPDHFQKWLENRGESIDHEYYSRREYGLYLRDLLKHNRGSRVQIILSEVVEIKKLEGHFRLKSSNGVIFATDKVILATGLSAPVAPHEVDADAAIKLTSPRHLGEIDWSTEKSVLIMGMGLSAIDSVLQLQELGQRGTLVSFSRHGLWPGAHRASIVLSGESQRLRAIGSPREGLRLWRELVKRHVPAGGLWQDVTLALRPFASEIWQRFSVFEKRRFLRHLRSYWELARHLAPEFQLRQIEDLVRAGRLTQRRDRIQSLEYRDRHFRVQWQSGRQPGNFDVVINATGLRPNHTLISDFFKFDEFGLHIDSDLHPSGPTGPDSNAYALGILTRGRFWESTAIPDIRHQAEHIARDILKHQRLRLSSSSTRSAHSEIDI